MLVPVPVPVPVPVKVKVKVPVPMPEMVVAAEMVMAADTSPDSLCCCRALAIASLDSPPLPATMIAGHLHPVPKLASANRQMCAQKRCLRCEASPRTLYVQGPLRCAKFSNQTECES